MTRCEICSKLIIKTPERHWSHPGVFIVNFEHRTIMLWTYFIPCSSVSISNFEHVIVGWVRSPYYTQLLENYEIWTIRIARTWTIKSKKIESFQHYMDLVWNNFKNLGYKTLRLLQCRFNLVATFSLKMYILSYLCALLNRIFDKLKINFKKIGQDEILDGWLCYFRAYNFL